MSPCGPDEWSSQDRALLAALAAGRPTRLIAEQAGISPRRVRREVRTLRVRLGARTDVHAVVEALRRGLV